MNGLLLVSLSWALPSPLREDAVAWRQWTAREGLPQNSVNSLLQSQDGYIWMTTFGGIVQFDGIDMTVHTPSNAPGMRVNRFTSSFEDSSGGLWFGAELGGLHRLDGGQIVPVPVDAAVDTQTINAITQTDDGTLWLGTDSGLYTLPRGGRWSRVPVFPRQPALPVYSLLPTEDGLWVGTRNGVLHHAGDTLTFLSEFRAWALAETPDGSLWLGGHGSLWRLRGDDRDEYQLDGQWVTDLAVDPEGRLWSSSEHHQLSWWEDGHLRSLPRPGADSLGSTARALLFDREGSLWVGTDAHGLHQIWEPGFTPLAGIGTPAKAIIEDRAGRTWLSSGCEGIFRLESDDSITDIPRPGGFCPQALALDAAGTLWAASHEQIQRMDDGWTPSTPFHEDLNLRALHFAPDGTLWAGSAGNGLLRLEGDDLEPVGLAGDNVQFITTAPDGSLWVGTQSGLVERTADGQLHRKHADLGLVRDVLFDADGTAWVGTYGAGLLRLRGDGVVRYTTTDGLLEDVVSRIIDDGEGGLWLNGNRGVSRVPRSDLEAVAAGERDWLQVATYDTGEGNGGFQPAGWKRRTGEVLFPTIHGAVVLSPQPQEATPPTTATIVSAHAGGEALSDGVEAPKGERELSFRYTALSLLRPDQTRFRYRLLGYDSTWREGGASRRADYTHLPPGEYRFQVIARNSDGVWSAAPAEMSVTIPPLLREQAWLQALLVGALLALAAGLVGARFRRFRDRNQRLRDEISARVRSEQQLREREAHYRTVFDRAADGFFLHDPQGVLLSINSTGCRMLGADAATLQAAPPLAFVSASSQASYKDLITQAVAGGEHSAEGQIAWGSVRFDARLAATRYDESSPARVLVTVVDLTEQRAAEAQRQALQNQLQHAEKLNALGQLAAGIAHDFNNLLTVISANAHIAAMHGGEVREVALEILSSSERGARLIRQLLAAGRQQTLRPAPFDLRAFARGQQRLLQPALPAEVALHLPEDGEPIGAYADASQLERVLLNLVLNARDAMPGGGTITVDVETRDVGVSAAPAEPGRYAVISVTDDGCGMDDKTRARIFEPFFSTKPTSKGAGLGLSSVNGIIDQSGGFIAVDSTPGWGSRFAIHLPHRELVVAELPPEAPEELVRVLLCDDQPEVLRSTARTLRRFGLFVDATTDPREAIARFGEDGGGYDVLVTDVNMPDLTGPQLVAALRARRPALPVVYISAYSGTLLPAEMQDPLISKPFRTQDLYAMILHQLQKS